MGISFIKYHGHGNDFIIIDNRDNTFAENNAELIKKMCDRRYGIGADGLMTLKKSANYVYEMKYYNADGNIGSMCGNGGRCMAHFANNLGIITNENKFVFEAYEKEYIGKIDGDIISIQFPAIVKKDFLKQDEHNIFVDTGSPHHVQIVPYIDAIDVVKRGREIRNSSTYIEKGTNVNFVQIISADKLEMRTYERGVEDETHSCGTGTVACVLVAHKYGNILEPKCTIQTLGGSLYVSFKESETHYINITYSGKVNKVFAGEYLE